MVKTAEEKRKWATGNGEHYTAQVADFRIDAEQFISNQTIELDI